MRLALKIDVDTLRGTQEGVPRLAALLMRLGVNATFLFSLGPDHTGRAIRRVFRPGFVDKVQRTSVVSHYGLRTLLYGTLLPGPHIARRCAATLRSIARAGFEAGVHCHDHVRWQDGVERASDEWTRRELEAARAEFHEVFDRLPDVHGAAGWQMNRHVPELERELGFRYASDVRGDGPFIPISDGHECGVPQLPTTLPTFDELLGREESSGDGCAERLLRMTAASTQDHVFTLHAELEGGAYLESFERLLRGWRDQGRRLCSLREYYATLDIARLARSEIVAARVPGRAGALACQAAGTRRSLSPLEI